MSVTSKEWLEITSEFVLYRYIIYAWTLCGHFAEQYGVFVVPLVTSSMWKELRIGMMNDKNSSFATPQPACLTP